MQTIKIFGAVNEARELSAQLRDVLPDGAEILSQQQPKSLDMDPATLALVITASQAVLVAAITAIGTVWAKKISADAEKSKKDDKDTSATVPKKVPIIEIETFTDSYVVIVDNNFEPNLLQVLPSNPKNVMNIRLRYNLES